MTNTTIVIATGNAHKVNEFSELFAANGMHTTALPITQLVADFDPDETGDTFEENSFIKAIAGFDQTGLSVLADDSGLEVDALQGAPGVLSARYSGEGATDASNRELLSTRLQEQGLTESTARFRCVLSLVSPSSITLAEGSCEGKVVLTPRGENGFGYDSMFIPHGYDETFGELPSHVKHSLSHRANAVQALVHKLTDTQVTQYGLSDIQHMRFLLSVASTCVLADTSTLRHLLSSIRMDEQLLEHTYEMILQSYLFAGFPAALDALSVLHDVTGHTFTHVPEAFQPQAFESRGEETCRLIYGNVYDKMIPRLHAMSPELQQWMIIEGYGKTLSRPQLPLVLRELGTVCMLGMLRRTTQLYSHVRGALNAGASHEQLEECINIVIEHADKRSGQVIEDILRKLS